MFAKQNCKNRLLNKILLLSDVSEISSETWMLTVGGNVLTLCQRHVDVLVVAGVVVVANSVV